MNISTHMYGYFILTGSQNILLNKAISQTLAGRISILTLLPLSINELKEAGLLSTNLENTMFTGMYPRIFDEKIRDEKPLHLKNGIQITFEHILKEMCEC